MKVLTRVQPPILTVISNINCGIVAIDVDKIRLQFDADMIESLANICDSKTMIDYQTTFDVPLKNIHQHKSNCSSIMPGWSSRSVVARQDSWLSYSRGKSHPSSTAHHQNPMHYYHQEVTA